MSWNRGVLAALGSALLFSPTTLSLGEWWGDGGGGDRGHHRALAYGVTLSAKNVVGSACPFLLRLLLDRYGLGPTLRIWAGVVAATGIPAVFLVPTPAWTVAAALGGSVRGEGAEEEEGGGGAGGEDRSHGRRIPWAFLRHRSFYVHSAAIVLQACGYGIPQTYLGAYAHDVARLSQASATLLLTLFNVPGIAASTLFGYLADKSTSGGANRRVVRLSATTVTAISAVSSALAIFLFWGLTSPGKDGGSRGLGAMALLVLFSVTFGFFAGGYSATWGGIIHEMASEAAHRNEAIDTGMVYGLLNGARGVGYVIGGLVGVPLLNAGSNTLGSSFGYGTVYGPLIIFTGLSSAFGGWGLLWKWKGLPRLL
jgi:sugar phosphate permease